jgi:hypothetical protein
VEEEEEEVEEEEEEILYKFLTLYFFVTIVGCKPVGRLRPRNE